MWPWVSAADPGRVHTEGRMARVALEDARERVATLFGTRPRQVVFTSGATEAINAAVYGALHVREATGGSRPGRGPGPGGAQRGPRSLRALRRAGWPRGPGGGPDRTHRS